MAQIGMNFDARTVTPNGSQDVLPAGWYQMMIDESEMCPTSSGNGDYYLKVRLNVMSGPHAARKIFTNLNLKNSNEIAQRIGWETLSAICHATGVMQVNDSSALHGIPMNVKLKIRPAKGDYEAQNEVTAFKNINEQVEYVGGGAGGAGGAMGAPAMSAPAQNPMNQPAQQPAWNPAAQQQPAQQPAQQWAQQTQQQPVQQQPVQRAQPQWAQQPAQQQPAQQQQPQGDIPGFNGQQGQTGMPAWANQNPQQPAQQQQQAQPAQQQQQMPPEAAAAQGANPPWAQASAGSQPWAQQ